jgi:hypothetical protein
LVGEFIGLRAGMGGAAALVIGAGVLLFFSPVRRLREAPAIAVEPEAVL